MHPILDALDGTPHEWIKKLLFTFNEGNIGKFEALAPLFPQEVRLIRRHSSEPVILHTCFSVAHFARKLRLSQTENLSHGSHRVCLQTRCRQPDNVIPEHCRGDKAAAGRG